jgi:hypothetical protein
MGQFATLNVDIGSIISGADEVANLETALNNVATSSKDKLGQELENVKVRPLHDSPDALLLIGCGKDCED